MIINIVGLTGIALIIWWFWLYKPDQTVTESNEILIEVKKWRVLTSVYSGKRKPICYVEVFAQR